MKKQAKKPLGPTALNRSPRATREHQKLTAWISLLVFALATVPFLPCLSAGFVYDDVWMVRENPHYRGLGWQQLAWMFTTFHMGHYQPLTWLTLGLDYVLWGENPRGYHLTSILFHAICAVAVYRLAELAIRRGLQGSSQDTPNLHAIQFGAIFAALVFALHPLRVESVAWVTDRADLVATLFLLLSLLAYLRAHPEARSPVQKGWLAAAVTFIALSLLGRGSGIMLPVILLMLDWYPLRRLAGGRLPPARFWQLLHEKAPFLMLAAAAAAVAPVAKAHARLVVPLAEHGLLGRLLQSCYGLVFYLQKTLIPANLVPMYELRPPLNALSARYLIPVVLVLAALAGLWRYRHKAPALVAALGAYGVALLPVLGLVQAGPQEVADRYSYFPAVFYSILAGGALAWLVQRRKIRPAYGLLSIAGVIVAVLAVLSWRQCQVWQNEEALWVHAAKHGPPSAFVQFNLGTVLARRGQTQEAVEAYARASELAPDWPQARFYYANGLCELGRLEQAVQNYQKALKLQPSYAEATLRLASTLVRMNRLEEATAAYEHLLRLEPQNPAAWFNLGVLQQRLGRLAEAADSYKKALQVAPDLNEARCNLASVLAGQGQIEAAISQLHEVLRRDPNHAEAQRGLEILSATTRPAP
jgi:tetratricopeptide (TPR) repeat protein